MTYRKINFLYFFSLFCSDYCFRLVNFKATFVHAEAFCKERNGLLGFADTEEIWNQTIDFLMNHGFAKSEIWTGVRKVSRSTNVRVACFFVFTWPFCNTKLCKVSDFCL